MIHLIQTASRFCLFLLIGCLPVCLFSQEITRPELEDFQSQLIEEFVENIDSEEFEYNTLIEDLLLLLNNPINLNDADFEDLKQLRILNDIQINDILNHIDQHGNILSLYELQSIPSISSKTVFLLKAFVTVDESINDYHLSLKDMVKDGKNALFLKWRRTINQQQGYVKDEDGNSNYLGDPNRLYMRYRRSYSNRLRMGFTAEKDAGEQFFSGANKKGFDYYSAHFHLRDYSQTIKDLAIGDYTVSMGQGLILHNDFGSGKSVDVMNVKRGGRAIKSYSSVNESNFNRGIGATLRFGKSFEVTAFGSYKGLDGNIIEEDTTDNVSLDEVGVSSFSQDGFHRTESEISKRNTVNETAFGTILKLKTRKLKIGLNALYSSFSRSLDRDIRLYNQFLFVGNRLLNTSVDYSYRYRNINFFGEVARSDNGGMAYLNGLLMGLDKHVDLSLLYRNYSPNYQHLNANAFGESSSVNNEKGIYVGLNVRPHNQWTISAYADFWTFPWLKNRVDAPSRGFEYFFKINYYQKRKLTVYLQYKNEQKEINTDILAGNFILNANDLVLPSTISRVRLHFAYKFSKSFEIKNRIELSFFKTKDIKSLDLGFFTADAIGNKSNGFLIYQDIIFKPENLPVSFTGRFALFDTDDFNSRIYAYENDLLNEFYIPFFRNKGIRTYLNVRYDVNRVLTAEFRVAHDFISDRETIGSGNNEISNEYISANGYKRILGVSQTQLKAQIRLRF